MLIKGVNKRIIEVLNPEDEYFEKVVFFLNPEYPNNQAILSKKTQSYLTKLSGQVKKKKKLKRKWILAGQLFSAAAVGAAATFFAASILF